MKITKRKTIPEAPAEVSVEINRLANIRDTMRMLAVQVKASCKIIVKFGSCHNDV